MFMSAVVWLPVLLIGMSLQICSICGFCFDKFNSWTYVQHMRCHRGMKNCLFECRAKDCALTYKNWNSLKSHYQRKHGENLKMSTSQVHAGSLELQSIGGLTSLSCSAEGCGKECKSYALLLVHLKGHIQEGSTIECPFDGCFKNYHNISSLTSHLSRLHTAAVNRASWSAEEYPVNATCSGHKCENSESFIPEPSTMVLTGPLSDDDVVTKSLALAFLGLESRYLVSNAATQFLVESLSTLHEITANKLQMHLKRKLEEMDLSPAECNELETVMTCQTSDLCQDGPLHSVYSRHQYYANEFSYVKPEKLVLGCSKNGPCEAYYVPLKKSIAAFLLTDAVKKILTCDTDRERGCPDLLRDINDGLKYQRGFAQGGLELFIFQDAFEPANPIGSRKGKHKILGVYGVLANLPPKYRSAIDSIFLIMILKEPWLKEFGHDTVFHRLLSDLTDLETNGVSVGGTSQKCRLFALIGDNLGAHTVGGFVESFSGNHFCRYCLITKQELSDNPLASGVPRTVESYNESLSTLQSNPSRKIVDGVKFDCVFNRLHSFHVCDYGMPPCIGHDLFEGVVAYDLKLIIDSLVHMRWFSYDCLNERIDCFKLSGTDKVNKPAAVRKQAPKLSGHAVQNWTLLRIFPLLVYDCVKDPDNKMWRLCMLLREMVELICAPAIFQSQISWLEICVNTFLYERQLCFPQENLKPKHHYLSHYGDLIRELGPLIRLWTMRFESKHGYFKRCVRSCRNFRNLCYTLSQRHQLSAAYSFAGYVLKPDLVYTGGEALMPELCSKEIREILEFAELNDLNCITARSATHCGIEYRQSMYVIHKNSFAPDLILHKILMIMVKNKTVLYFAVRAFWARRQESMGVYILEKAMETCPTLVKVSDLLDPFPLQEHSGLFVLRHALPDC